MKKFLKVSECQPGRYYMCGLSGKTMLCFTEGTTLFRYWDEHNNEYQRTTAFDGQLYEHPTLLQVGDK